MANIKCRYTHIKCELSDPVWVSDKKNICPEYWDNCYSPEKEIDCPYSKFQNVEFEKNYKFYEFIEGEVLRIHGREIDVDSIEYLEIDGRILINDTEDED